MPVFCFSLQSPCLGKKKEPLPRTNYIWLCVRCSLVLSGTASASQGSSHRLSPQHLQLKSLNKCRWDSKTSAYSLGELLPVTVLSWLDQWPSSVQGSILCLFDFDQRMSVCRHSSELISPSSQIMQKVLLHKYFWWLSWCYCEEGSRRVQRHAGFNVHAGYAMFKSLTKFSSISPY